MNIHEHQAKEILKKYGAIVPAGFFSTNVDDLIEKAKNLKTEKYVLKAFKTYFSVFTFFAFSIKSSTFVEKNPAGTIAPYFFKISFAWCS